jgi:hypothetical protein
MVYLFFLCALEPLSLCVKGALALSSLLAYLAIRFSSSGVRLFHGDSAVQMHYLFFLCAFVVKAFVLHLEVVAWHKWHAVALSEPSAANTPIQRHQPNHPPTQNVNSAPRSLTSAGHFGGSIAQFAICAFVWSQSPTAISQGITTQFPPPSSES